MHGMKRLSWFYRDVGNVAEVLPYSAFLVRGKEKSLILHTWSKAERKCETNEITEEEYK